MAGLLWCEREVRLGVNKCEGEPGGTFSTEVFSSHQEAAEGTGISGIVGNAGTI
jgi:hypothetical protein